MCLGFRLVFGQQNLELLLVSDSAERCTNAKHLTFYAAEDHHLCAALM